MRATNSEIQHYLHKSPLSSPKPRALLTAQETGCPYMPSIFWNTCLWFLISKQPLRSKTKTQVVLSGSHITLYVYIINAGSEMLPLYSITSYNNIQHLDNAIKTRKDFFRKKELILHSVTQLQNCLFPSLYFYMPNSTLEKILLNHSGNLYKCWEPVSWNCCICIFSFITPGVWKGKERQASNHVENKWFLGILDVDYTCNTTVITMATDNAASPEFPQTLPAMKAPSPLLYCTQA